MVQLKLSKSNQLSVIESNSFADMKASLKELHLKNTGINLVEDLYHNVDDPPYHNFYGENISSTFWLNNLNLSLLSIDYLNIPTEMHNQLNTSFIMCKFFRYIPKTSLVILQADQECNCFVYFIYQQKMFIKNWEYRTPTCYR